MTTALDETPFPLGTSKTSSEEILRSTTANHLSCHALASPWRANVSSCEERNPPTLRATSSLRARAWRFVLLNGSHGERVGISTRILLATLCLLTHLSSKQPRLYKKLEDRTSGWVRRYAGPGTYSFWKIVINGIRFGSAYMHIFNFSPLLCYACFNNLCTSWLVVAFPWLVELWTPFNPLCGDMSTRPEGYDSAFDEIVCHILVGD